MTMVTSETAQDVASSADSTPAGRLELASAAHDAGDFAAVRELLVGLGEGLDEHQQEQLQLLRARTQVDAVQIWILLACLGLFCAVAWKYVL